MEEAAAKVKTLVNSGQESRGNAALSAATYSVPLTPPQSKIPFIFSFVLLLTTSCCVADGSSVSPLTAAAHENSFAVCAGGQLAASTRHPKALDLCGKFIANLEVSKDRIKAL